MSIRCSWGRRTRRAPVAAGVAFGPKRVSDGSGSNSTAGSVGARPGAVKACRPRSGRMRNRSRAPARSARSRRPARARPRVSCWATTRVDPSRVACRLRIVSAAGTRGAAANIEPALPTAASHPASIRSRGAPAGFPTGARRFMGVRGIAGRSARSSGRPYLFRCSTTESGSMRTRAPSGRSPTRLSATRWPTRSASGSGPVQ